MQQLITDDYAALNRELHARGKYGIGSYRLSGMVETLRTETGSDSVLDYGCGQGALGRALGSPGWLREYDPAIDGKDGKPESADLVVCTDVLEHVEPDLIDNVLRHIADLSLKATFLVVSLREASKTLPDGRNAHLIVRPAEWWREKLAKLFFIDSWTATADEATMIGQPVRSINNVIPISAVSDTIRYEQAVINCAVVKDRVRAQPRHDRRCALVCYGPSLRQTWPMLWAERKAWGATIVTVSGAHDFLIGKGIVPDIHIECDPREHKAHFTRNPHPDVTYWPASCSHPKLINQLQGHKLALWHVYNSESDRRIIAPDGIDPGNTLLAGAGSVGCRAMNLMFTQGYRTFSIFGMDCSFTDEQHAGDHSGKRQQEWPVRVGERWFKSSGALVSYAQGFLWNLQTLIKVCRDNGEPMIEGTDRPVEVFMHGDGLLQEMCRVGEASAAAA